MHQVRRDDVFNSVHKYVTHALDGDRWAYVRSDYAGPTWLQSTGPGVYDSFLSFCLIANPAWGVAPNQCHTYDALGSEFAPEERSDAFGTGGGLGLEFGYRDYLSTTALYQLWHRWYDPTTGRFVSRDPIARHGVTAYPYVRQSPTRYIDPTGLIGRGPGLGATRCAAWAARLTEKALKTEAEPTPASCQKLNNELYNYLHACEGLTVTIRAAHEWVNRPVPPEIIVSLQIQRAYDVWRDDCHEKCTPKAPAGGGQTGGGQTGGGQGGGGGINVPGFGGPGINPPIGGFGPPSGKPPGVTGTGNPPPTVPPGTVPDPGVPAVGLWDPSDPLHGD